MRFLKSPEISDYTPAYRQALNLIWYRAGRDYETILLTGREGFLTRQLTSQATKGSE